jgi:acetylornithine deacetylase/succinyl-diaminopimelate desuccinylase-like protein
MAPDLEIDLDAIIDDIMALVRLQATTPEAAARVLEFVGSRLEGLGIPSVIHKLPSGKVLTADVGAPMDEAQTVIWLLAHADVVRALPASDLSQYVPVVDGHILRGRGVLDMHGATVANVHLMPLLADRPGVAVSSSSSTMRKGRRLIPSATTWSSSATEGNACRTSSSGEATNLQVAVGLKALIRVEMTVRARGGHSSTPWEVPNLIAEQVELWKGIAGLPFAETTTAEYPQGPSIVMTGIGAGDPDSKTSIPSECVTWGTVRPLHGQDMDDVARQIQGLVADFADRIPGDRGPDLIRLVLSRPLPSFAVNRDDPYVQWLSAVTKRHYPEGGDVTFRHGWGDLAYCRGPRRKEGEPAVLGRLADDARRAHPQAVGAEYGLVGKGQHGEEEELDTRSVPPYMLSLLAFVEGLPLA